METRTRQVRPNDETGFWDVFENDAWLARFESESVAVEFATVPDLIEGLRFSLREFDTIEAALLRDLVVVGRARIAGITKTIRAILEKLHQHS